MGVFGALLEVGFYAVGSSTALAAAGRTGVIRVFPQKIRTPFVREATLRWLGLGDSILIQIEKLTSGR